MMIRQIIQKLSGGGGAPGMPPGQPPQGGPPGMGGPPDQSSQAGQQIGQQLSELQGADPQSMLKMLQQIKSVMVALYPRSAFTIPGVARNIAQAQKYIDNAIKEAEQAAATANTVQQPIANNAGQPQQGPGPADGGNSLPGLQSFAMGAQ